MSWALAHALGQVEGVLLHLDFAEAEEIERLLMVAFRGHGPDAVGFLMSHNHGLMAKPLDLIRRDRRGLERVLEYLRAAAGNRV